MNYYDRVDRVLAHLYEHKDGNPFYESLIKYFRIRGTLTVRQVESVERNMVRDIRIRREKGVLAIREWNRNH